MRSVKIFGVVVLYHPDETIIENINSYVDEIEALYVIDNSETKDEKLLKKLLDNQKCIYIDNNGNQGIAQALNTGAKKAIEDAASWLLTMDQDSRFENEALKIMIDWIKNNKTTNIGIISPMHSQKELDKYLDIFDYMTMTSGNLLNLDIFSKIGEFEEKLFIDSVDTEYCLRLKHYGYKIKRIKSIVLKHNLGDMGRHKVMNVTMEVSNHSIVRRYYITRNRLYIWSKYEAEFRKYIRYEKETTLRDIIKIFLFEDQKILKLKMILKAYKDYKAGKFGKYIA